MSIQTTLPRLGAALRLTLCAALTALCLTPAAHAEPATPEKGLRFGGATGGIFRFPNTNQDEDDGNAFGEIWVKGDVELYRAGDTKLKAYVLANYVRDTEPYAYNNTRKAGIGLSLSTRVGKHLELTFSARHDWFAELDTTTRRQGMMYTLDYYYYRYWPADGEAQLFGLTKRAAIFKSYGTLQYPGSLIKGDTNLVLTVGGEYSADYMMPNSEWLLTPFVDAHFAWDKDQNNYNNKIIPAVGVKLRRPIDKGELFAGIKFEADFRPVNGTLHTGPMLFAGWYKGF